MDKSVNWATFQRALRAQYLPDRRKISYKKLSDHKLQVILPAFLDAADSITGCLVSIISNRGLRDICTAAGQADELLENIDSKANWKPRDFEQAFRLAHVVACLTGGFSVPGQNVYWISDRDNAFANTRQAVDTARIVSRCSSHYVKHALGKVGVGTVDMDEGDRLEEDLCAISDLAAGALAEAVNLLSAKCGGRIPVSVDIPTMLNIKPKASLIADWFWGRHLSLCKIAVLFEQHGQSNMSVSKLEMY